MNYTIESARRPVSRVLSDTTSRRRRDGHSSGTRIAARLTRPTRATGRKHPCVNDPPFPGARHAGRPYSVLLPVGFALPPLLPGARCALAAPFHPCLRRLPLAGPPAPAVCSLWHFPWGCPRRPLAGTVFPWSPDFPPPGLPPAAAVRPSGEGEMRPAERRVNYRPRSRLILSHAALIRATLSLARAMNSGGTPRLARLSGWFSRISCRQAARRASSAMSRGTPSTW